ncbi:MAG: hypothetical protein IKM53_03920 [Clostridia bacterium]|nr:hypothetical protein [Clostridia bacterium]
MQFGSKFVKAVAMMLVLVCALACVSCVPETSIDIIESIPDLGLSSSEDIEENSSKIPTEEGHTEAPVVHQSFNLEKSTVILAGSCEKDALIEVVGTGKVSASTVADGEKYLVEVELGSNKSSILEVYATAEGKEKSVATTLTVSQNAVAENRVDGYATVVGQGFNLFFEKTLNDYKGANLMTKTVSQKFIDDVNSRVANLANRGDAELVYVLVPNEVSVYPELLPEDVVRETNNTRFSQVKDVLEASNASVIDLTDALVAAKGAEGEENYPLYYDTYSQWSEYGAYVAYTEIMNYVAQKFPAAAPRALGEFDIKEVEADGGDLAYFLGLDREFFSETVIDLVPKFDLNIGDIKGDEEETFVIGELKQYGGENDYRIYNAYYRSKLSSVDPEVVPADGKVYFRTGRTELPSAVIYRDEASIPMIDFLAERFNNVLIDSVGNYSVNMTNVEKFAGTEGNTSVDYVFVIISESNLGNIVPLG